MCFLGVFTIPRKLFISSTPETSNLSLNNFLYELFLPSFVCLNLTSCPVYLVLTHQAGLFPKLFWAICHAFCYINTKSDQNVICVNFSTLICLKYKYREILWFRWNTWSWTSSDHGLRHKQWLYPNSWVWEIFADLWSGCTLQLSSYLVSNWSWESQYFPHHLESLVSHRS